jgi:hypothetical protein
MRKLALALVASAAFIAPALAGDLAAGIPGNYTDNFGTSRASNSVGSAGSTGDLLSSRAGTNPIQNFDWTVAVDAVGPGQNGQGIINVPK